MWVLSPPVSAVTRRGNKPQGCGCTLLLEIIDKTLLHVGNKGKKQAQVVVTWVLCSHVQELVVAWRDGHSAKKPKQGLGKKCLFSHAAANLQTALRVQHLIILFSKYQKQLGVIMEPSLANFFIFYFKSKLQNFLEFLIPFHAKFSRGKNKGLDNSPLLFLNSYKHLCFEANTSRSCSALPGAIWAA